MTARRLKATVYIDGKVFGPSDDVPQEYADRIGDHAWVVVQDVAADVDVDAQGSDGPPPQSGRGSGEAAWSAWAAANEVDVPEGAKRDDIIAALTAAGVPVE